MCKKVLILLLLLALCLPGALAEEAFSLDDRRIFRGMDITYAQGYVPAVENGEMKLIVPVRAEGVRGQITARLTILSPELSPFVDSAVERQFRPEAEGRGYQIAFQLPLRRDAYNGLYAATLHLEGKNATGEALSGDIPLSLPFLSGKSEDLSSALQLLELQPGEGGLKPGEAGLLRLHIRNAGQRATLNDILLTLSSTSGSILPTGGHTIGAGSLPPGEARWVELPVILQPDAAPILHVLSLTAQFSGFEGEPQSGSRSFTLPVTNEMILRYGKPQLPQVVTQGDLVNFTLPLMNMGRASLRNVLLTFSLPGISEGESVLAGSIEPGDTVQGKATFQVSDSARGNIGGEVTITYEDARGSQGSLSLPITTEVLARKPLASAAQNPGAAAQPAQEAPKLSPLERWWPLGLAALLLILALGQTIHYRRKLRRLEEQKL